VLTLSLMSPLSRVVCRRQPFRFWGTGKVGEGTHVVDPIETKGARDGSGATYAKITIAKSGTVQVLLWALKIDNRPEVKERNL
jgi:hypothetical protein